LVLFFVFTVPLTSLLLFHPVNADQKEGAFGSGVKAKSTTKSPTNAPSPDSKMPDRSDVTVCFGGKQYAPDGKKTPSSGESVASAIMSLAGCTFNGKAVGGPAVEG
jgi:hypothetical protein